MRRGPFKDARGGWHDRWGRFASSRAAARAAKPPAPPPREASSGRFRGDAPLPPLPTVRHRGKDGRFAKGRVTVRDRVRELPFPFETDPENVEEWEAPKVRPTVKALDRSTNAHRVVMVIVLGYFLDESPEATGGTETDPIVRHFTLGTMTGLEALQLTRDDIVNRVADETADSSLGPFIVLDVLCVMQRRDVRELADLDDA